MLPEIREVIDKIVGGVTLADEETYLELLASDELPACKKYWLLHTLEDLKIFPPDHTALQYLLEQLFLGGDRSMKRATVTTMYKLNRKSLDRFHRRLIAVDSNFLTYLVKDLQDLERFNERVS